MQSIKRRLAALQHLTRPLSLAFVGMVILSFGVAYLGFWLYQIMPSNNIIDYLSLQFLPQPLRSILIIIAGVLVLASGIWHLGGVVVVPLPGNQVMDDEVVVSSRRDRRTPRIVVLSGGIGMLVLSELSRQAERMTCITPLQDPVEYYYRASGLGDFPTIYYVVPTPEPFKVFARLDDRTLINVMHVDYHANLAPRYVTQLFVLPADTDPAQVAANVGSPAETPQTVQVPLTRLAREAIAQADVILLGPGSLFESILPNLLIDELRQAVQQSSARKIYICNLMTEPGLTTGFSVGEHIRQIKRYGGFAPDYVLVNVQRIEKEIRDLYANASQAPVYLTPDEHEETAVPTSEQAAEQQLVLEGSVVIEADLASSVIQSRASVSKPGESRAVRVLRHDPEKLVALIMEVLRRE